MEALGVDFKLLLSQIVNFLVLFILLSWLLYKPITKLLAEREKKVKEAMEWAEKTKKESEELEEKVKERMEKTKQEAKEILDESRSQAEADRKKTLEIAQKESEEIVKKTKEQIEAEKEQMKEELKKETAKLAILAASKILDKSIDEKDQKRLSEEALREVK